MTELNQQDGVYVLHLGDGENRFTLDWIQQMHAHLDEVVSTPAPLVTTAGGKFYSNGLDLEWVLSNSDRMAEYVGRVQDLFARVLTLPVPTLAALQGHAFGAGAMLAMATSAATSPPPWSRSCRPTRWTGSGSLSSCSSPS